MKFTTQHIKNIFTTILLLTTLGTSISKAQENYSTVYIWSGKGYNKKATFTLGINSHRILSFRPYELAECKIYSSGHINFEILSTTTGRALYSEQIKIEPGNKYFLYATANAWNGAPKEEQLTEEEASEYFDDPKYFKNKLFFEENINDPIGKIDNKSTQTAGQGTGFLLNKDGYVITNHHVIEGANKISLTGINGDYNTSFEADVIATDAINDLAVLKIKTNLITFATPPYSIISSKNIKQGQNIYALGYPIERLMGKELKVTDGIINSNSGYQGSISQFQFSAPVQAGNSGGPLLTNNGEIIGIVSSKLNPELAESAGYAIKSDYLLFFLSQVNGVEYNEIDNQLMGKDLSSQVEATSNYVYIIKTE